MNKNVIYLSPTWWQRAMPAWQHFWLVLTDWLGKIVKSLRFPFLAK